MRKFRFLALAAAMLMLALTLASCGQKGPEPVTVNCHVKINGQDASIVNFDVAVVGNVENPPTVLDAAITALNRRAEDVKYELDVDDNDVAIGFISITDDSGNTYKVGYTDSTNEYLAAWEYTIDGVAPESGRMNTIPIQEGQQIEFSFNVYSVEELAAANP